ncbi:MAG: hypothetical protein AABW93_00150 [Nanoarchaeota archaeon]
MTIDKINEKLKIIGKDYEWLLGLIESYMKRKNFYRSYYKQNKDKLDSYHKKYRTNNEEYRNKARERSKRNRKK